MKVSEVGGFCMSVFISLIIPYVIILLSFVLTSIQVAYQSIIETILIASLIGVWFIHISKTEGKKYVLYLLTLTLILLCFGDALCLMYEHVMSDVFVLCTVLELFAIGMISRHKPRISMTYRYSYKNKRRRYF